MRLPLEWGQSASAVWHCFAGAGERLKCSDIETSALAVGKPNTDASNRIVFWRLYRVCMLPQPFACFPEALADEAYLHSQNILNYSE